MDVRIEEKPVRRALSERLRPAAARVAAFLSSGRRLIAAAALLHVTLAVALFVAGRAQLAPGLVNRDGIMESFAFDSYAYQQGAARLASVLKESGLKAWATEPTPAHVKLISIQFALLGPLFGHSTLSAEPFNLFCYVAILSLVLLLGREVGGRRVGLVAAGLVALWPTFLLHTTQFLKDPLFIAGALALVLIVTTWLTRTYNWVGAVCMGALMALTTALLLLVRHKFGVVIYAVVFFGFALLVVRQALERRLLCWNLVSPLLILVAGTLTVFFLTTTSQKLKQYPSTGGGQPKAVAGPGKQAPAIVSYKSSVTPDRAKTPPTYVDRLRETGERIAHDLGHTRHRYNVGSPESGSAVDRNVELKSPKEMVLYLPRAFQIGFWSPFPNTWLDAGARVGGAGRLLSGAETLIIYLCQFLALLCLWREPRSLSAWLLLLIIVFGVTALGLVVSNVGTLYRFRYPFWMLLIILAVKGIDSLLTKTKAEGRAGGGRQLKKRVAVAACLVAAVFGSCSPRAPHSQLDFTLINFTGVGFRALYVSPLGSPGWEENLLAGDALVDGDAVEIKFSPEEKSALWDVRAESTDGSNFAEWKGLNLRQISKIIVSVDRDIAIAEAE